MQDVGGGRYRLVSYVDTQSEFGADVRLEYFCEWQAGRVVEFRVIG